MIIRKRPITTLFYISLNIDEISDKNLIAEILEKVATEKSEENYINSNGEIEQLFKKSAL